MGALRRAGVWLGLVEDDDDYTRTERERGYASRDDRYADDDYDANFAYEDDLEYASQDDDYAEPVRSRTREPQPERAGTRVAAASAPRASVSPISSASSVRSGQSADARSVSGFASHDNLALAPQVALRERAVVSEDEQSSRRITTLHPTTYNDARNIGEHFRNSVPVIMNLTEMDEADAKRLVDFAAGLAFGLRGSIERVTNRVFLLSPASVTVTAEDRARIAEGGFFNQS